MRTWKVDGIRFHTKPAKQAKGRQRRRRSDDLQRPALGSFCLEGSIFAQVQQQTMDVSGYGLEFPLFFGGSCLSCLWLTLSHEGESTFIEKQPSLSLCPQDLPQLGKTLFIDWKTTVLHHRGPTFLLSFIILSPPVHSPFSTLAPFSPSHKNIISFLRDRKKGAVWPVADMTSLGCVPLPLNRRIV